VRKKTVSGIMRTLLFIGMLILTFNIQPVKAGGTIYVRADGSVDPHTAPISSVDNITYTFTDNIYDEIVVERDNIEVDGAGYTLQGTGVEDSKGIYLSGRSNITIKNIEIKAFTNAIRLDHSSNNTIFGNNITNNNGESILLDNSPNNTINKNNIVANNGGGIELNPYSPSNYNSICGNNITANNGHGIDLSGRYWDGSYNNLISGNSITENNGYGINLDSSSYNTISGNNITNRIYGIRIDASSNNDIFVNNITKNKFGIDLSSSTYNRISRNSVTNNGLAIGLDDSNYNSIYHNNFVDNFEQAYSHNSTNVWDDRFPSGGNYWSDHVCTGNPSNGSQPCIIDPDNIDYYPFQDPNGWLLTLEGDINRDGIVNILDAIILAGAFGSEPSDPNWNPNADMNNDETVNILDAILIAGNFGKTS
jgi:parallel beta-helix repeat protein